MRNYIAPLQPLTLAAFPPWGNSEGAGRIALIRRKVTDFRIIPPLRRGMAQGPAIPLGLAEEP